MIYIGFRAQFIALHFQAFLVRHESVRNAGAFIVAQGMLTPGVLAKIKKRDGGCPSESRAGGGPDVPVGGWCGKCDGRKDGGVVAGGSIPRGDAHRGICRHGT